MRTLRVSVDRPQVDLQPIVVSPLDFEPHITVCCCDRAGLSFARVEVSNATGTGGADNTDVASLTDSNASTADAPDTLSVEAWLEAIEMLDFDNRGPGDTRDEDASQTSD